MAQKVQDSSPKQILSSGVSTEYVIKCSSDLTLSLRKEGNFTLKLQKDRTKVELTMDDWRLIVANAESIELGYLIMCGNFTRLNHEHQISEPMDELLTLSAC